jgi:YesN/AraC family two-component response regulator
MKVLIVDDESEILNILEDEIEDKFMCEVDRAENGLDAFLLSMENKYDFIITDFKMPYMTGAALIMALKTRKNLNTSTPCLMLSGFITEELKAKLEIDHVQFMNKPMELDKICELLSPHLS